MASPSPPSLSIITVSLNEAPHVRRLAESVQRMESLDRVNIEMVLVDGGSEDGTLREAEACGFDSVIVVPGGSIPVCRNRGALAASGTWLAYLDADCEPRADWLTQLLAYLDDGKPIITGWPVCPPEENTWVQRAWYFHWTSKNACFTTYNDRRVVEHEAFRLLTTRNMIIHQDLFDQLDGFGENLPTGEDTDFVFRAHNAGMTVIADPALQVCHFGEPATLSEFYKQQTWHANRASYARIAQEQAGGSGGNAPRFALLFLVGLLLSVAGLTGSLALQRVWPLLGALPLFLVVLGPAVLISVRGGTCRHVIQLCALYFLYGLARALDLAGFYRIKKSWKS